MAEVFGSGRTGAQVVVFSHDHCPPHVSAIKRSDAGVARVRFSFVTDAVTLWDIDPLQNAPRRREIGALLDEVQDHLAQCRSCWWAIQRTTCLEGRLATMQAAGAPEILTLLTRRRGPVRQVRRAVYNRASESLLIGFDDGSKLTMKAGIGVEA